MTRYTATSRFTRVCLKPTAYITYRGPGDYKDTQNVMPGRTAEELVGNRFPNGLPAGWTVEVTPIVTR